MIHTHTSLKKWKRKILSTCSWSICKQDTHWFTWYPSWMFETLISSQTDKCDGSECHLCSRRDVLCLPSQSRLAELEAILSPVRRRTWSCPLRTHLSSYQKRITCVNSLIRTSIYRYTSSSRWTNGFALDKHARYHSSINLALQSASQGYFSISPLVFCRLMRSFSFH